MSIRRMMLFTLGGFFKSIISLFKTRVLNDGGNFEAETNLENQLNTLGSDLFDSASLVITPNGVKTSKLYTIKPNDGTGDLSVVRNTSATRIDENGNIVNVPANVARIDYSTGQPAILSEPQRTNLILQSEDFTNGWAQEGISVLSNTQISPDGALTADSIFELITNDVHRTYRNSPISVTANAIYTASFFVKKNNIRYIRLILTQQGSATIWAGAQFDLDTQTFTSQVGIDGGVFSSASITSLSNGWYRISVSGSITGVSMIPMLALSNGATMLNTNTRGCPIYIGNVNNGLYLWGAQLEAGSNATSYIPTTTSSVTRNADIISKTEIIDLIGQTEGSIFCEFERTTETAGVKHLLTIYADAVNTTFLHLVTGTNSTNLILRVRVNSNQYQYAFTPIDGKNKLLVTYDNTGCDIFLNAVKLPKLALPTFPSLYNLNMLQYDNSRQYSSGYLFSFWKTKLSDQQAIQLTTL